VFGLCPVVDVAADIPMQFPITLSRFVVYSGNSARRLSSIFWTYSIHVDRFVSIKCTASQFCVFYQRWFVVVFIDLTNCTCMWTWLNSAWRMSPHVTESTIHPTSSLHNLLPPPREHPSVTRLRVPSKFPRIPTRTKKYQSFFSHALSHYQTS